eukprot:jgi/Orpsp1_1/1177019/evm.model.c7180000059843.1
MKLFKTLIIMVMVSIFQMSIPTLFVSAAKYDFPAWNWEFGLYAKHGDKLLTAKHCQFDFDNLKLYCLASYNGETFRAEISHELENSSSVKNGKPKNCVRTNDRIVGNTFNDNGDFVFNTGGYVYYSRIDFKFASGCKMTVKSKGNARVTFTHMKEHNTVSGLPGRCGSRYGSCSKYGHCCSKYNYCGTSSDYCRRKDCQENYGYCLLN